MRACMGMVFFLHGVLVNVDMLVLSPFPKFLSCVITCVVYPVSSSVMCSDTLSVVDLILSVM